MRVLDVEAVGTNYNYEFPGGDMETYENWVKYRAVAPNGQRKIRIGFCTRPVFGRDRKRVVVWIDGHPHAEFHGADDFEVSGDVLSEIRLRDDNGGIHICRYPDGVVPECYAGLPVVGLPTRVTGPHVRQAWAVVANIADHQTLCALAALRLRERQH